MNETLERQPTKRRAVRFSLRNLLLFVSLLVIALTTWRVFFYFPPAHRNPLYEFADSTRQLSAQIGPNKVSIKLVARNDRDGSVLIEDGKGLAVNGIKPHEQQVLANCGSWLDVVQVELEPGFDLLDVLEVRIFDHETHELITNNGKSFGWQCVRPNLIQIYGLGKKIPQKIDLWLRMESYDPKTEVKRLDPNIGSSCEMKYGTITVTDMCEGCNMHTVGKGLSLRPPQQHNKLAIEFEWQGITKANKETFFHFRAADDSGNRLNFSAPHYVRFSQSSPGKQAYFLDFEQQELDHFEFREMTNWPEGNRERFYFSAVELPVSSQVVFAKPPVAKAQVNGVEVELQLAEFTPLEVTITTHRGDWANGTTSNGYGTSIVKRPNGAIDLDTSSTLVYQIEGMGYIDATMKLLNKDQKVPKDTGNSSSSNSWNGSSRSGYQVRTISLEEVDSIELELIPH